MAQALELPQELCEIFFERVNIVPTPLPAQINYTRLTIRQVVIWRAMEHQWKEIHSRLINYRSSLNVFRSDWRHRIQRWELNHGIVQPPAPTGSSLQRAVAASTTLHISTKVFFGINGAYDLNTWTYVPAQERSRDVMQASPNPQRYALPAPQEVPPYYRQERAGLITFDAWLQQHPRVYQRFFPAEHAAWQVQIQQQAPPPPPLWWVLQPPIILKFKKGSIPAPGITGDAESEDADDEFEEGQGSDEDENDEGLDSEGGESEEEATGAGGNGVPGPRQDVQYPNYSLHLSFQRVEVSSDSEGEQTSPSEDERRTSRIAAMNGDREARGWSPL
jgi:hypothetical protein